MVDYLNFEEIERLYMGWCEFRKLEEERLIQEDLFCMYIDKEVMEENAFFDEMMKPRDSKLLGDLEGVFYFDSTKCISILGEEFLVNGHVKGFKLVGGNNSARRIFKEGSYWKSRSSEAKIDHCGVRCGRRERHKSVRYAVSVEVDDNGELVVDEITDRKEAYSVLENLVKPGYVVFVGIGDVPDEEEVLMEFFEYSEEDTERIYESWEEFRRLNEEFIAMSSGYNPKDYDYDPADLYARGFEEDRLSDLLFRYEDLEDRVLERYNRERLK